MPGSYGTKAKEQLMLIGLYGVLTFVLTYPVALRMNTDIPGGGDAWHWMWILWYTKSAILSPKPGMGLTYTNYIFYPEGIPLMPFPSAFNQLLSIPLQSILDLHVSYTVLWLMSFALGGYGAYLLVKYLTEDKIAAFISGAAFAFSPYHFAHASGHMGATTVEWIPFCALYLMKMFKEKGLRNSIYAGLFFILVAMSDLQYMVFMGVMAGLLLAYEVWCALKSKCLKSEALPILKRYVVFASISIMGILPIVYHMVSSGELALKVEPSEAITYSADLLGFFIPSTLHPIFGGIVEPFYRSFTGNPSESTTFIGYTVLLLSFIALLRLRKRGEVRFWIISSAFFTMISMGPILHVCGETKFTAFDVAIPLPYIVLYHLLPPLENCRTVSRFFVIAVLSFAVLSGFGLSHILSKLRNCKKYGLSILLLGLIVFEFMVAPFPTSFVDKPSFYKKISKEEDRFALLEIPRLDYDAEVKFMYYQTIHGKPIVGGYYARFPRNVFYFQTKTPLIREALPDQLKGSKMDILNQNLSEIGESILNYYKLRYVVIHKTYLSEEEIHSIKSLLDSVFKREPIIYEDEGLMVYEVKKDLINQFMILGDHWHNLELHDGVPSRWISNNATMLIYSPNEKVAILNFRIMSFYRPRDLKVYLNEEPILNRKIPMDSLEIKMYMRLRMGENTIRFYTPDGCQRPCDVPELENKDIRCLSFLFQNITLAEIKS